MYCKTTNTKLLNRMSIVKDIAIESSMRMMPTLMTATTALSADRTMLSSKSLRKMVQFRDNRYRRERNEHRFNQFRDQEETQRLHCERQALWRGVCPRRAERGALARAGMARAEDICPSWRRPLFPISGTTLRLCGPPMMAKTVLDLLHSLGVDDADIRFDNFGG